MQTLTLTTTASFPSAAPTQGLRDLIDLFEGGFCSVEDVHNELLRLEAVLGLPMTVVSPYNGLPPEAVEEMKADEAAYAAQLANETAGA